MVAQLSVAPTGTVLFLIVLQLAGTVAAFRFLYIAIPHLADPVSLPLTRAILFSYIGYIPASFFSLLLTHVVRGKNEANLSGFELAVANLFLVLAVFLIGGAALMATGATSASLLVPFFVPMLVSSVLQTREESVESFRLYGFLFFAASIGGALFFPDFAGSIWKAQSVSHFNSVWPGYGSGMQIFAAAGCFTIITQLLFCGSAGDNLYALFRLLFADSRVDR